MGKSGLGLLPGILVGLSLLLCLTAGFLYIDLPGLYYDEALFVNAALGGINDYFVYKRILGVPVMLMPYLGALKAFLYAPIFDIFEVSPASIRVPALVISAVTLLISFALARRFLPSLGAAALVGLMATDPTFIFSSKLDWGPIVLMMFLKMLALLCFWRLIETGMARFTWALTLVLLLGVYDKLNFIWFFLALYGSAFAVYRHRLSDLVRDHRSGFRASLAVMLIVTAVVSVWVLVRMSQPFQPGAPGGLSFQRFHQVLALYAYTFDGKAVYHFLFEEQLASPTLIHPYLIAALVFPAWSWMTRGQAPATTAFLRVPSAFFALLFVLLFLQIALTPQATGPHHVLMLFPFPHLLILMGLVRLDQKVAWKHAGRVLAVTLFVILLASQVAATLSYLAALRTGSFRPVWSAEIYRLSDFLNRHSHAADRIISADWGLHNQVFALSRADRAKYFDLWPSFQTLQVADEMTRQRLYHHFFRGQRVYVLLHSEPATVMPRVRTNFFEFASEFSITAVRIARFEDEADRPIYEIYRVE